MQRHLRFKYNKYLFDLRKHSQHTCYLDYLPDVEDSGHFSHLCFGLDSGFVEEAAIHVWLKIYRVVAA
jgi:hypothetical protein